MNKENLAVVSLWVGTCKPNMDILFQPLVEPVHNLSHSGLVVDTPFGKNILKFSSVLGIFDIVAKAPILNMNHFNGANGFPTCLHPGIWTVSHYYLPGQEYSLRTNQSIVEAAANAERRKVVMMA